MDSATFQFHGSLNDFPHLPENTAHYYDEFRRCTDCGRMYWKGAHVERMQGVIDAALGSNLTPCTPVRKQRGVRVRSYKAAQARVG